MLKLQIIQTIWTTSSIKISTTIKNLLNRTKIQNNNYNKGNKYMSNLIQAPAEYVEYVLDSYKLIHPRFDDLTFSVECSEDERYFRIKICPTDMTVAGLGGEIIGTKNRIDPEVKKSVGLYLDEMKLNAQKEDNKDKLNSVYRYLQVHRKMTNPKIQGRNIELMKEHLGFVFGMHRRKDMQGENKSWKDYQPIVDIIFYDAKSEARRES